MEAIVEQVRVSNTKSGRATVVMSFVLGNYPETFSDFAENIGSTVEVTVTPIARQLGLGDNPNAGLPEGVQKVWESRGGDVLGPHAYEEGADGKFCSKCGWPHAHPAHELVPVENGA